MEHLKLGIKRVGGSGEERWSSTVTEQDPMGPSQNRLPAAPPCPTPASCLLKNFSLLGLPQVPKSKFNQRSEKMQKDRKTVKQDKIIL